MKILSWNVNGIRAAQRNGLLDWMGSQHASIICLQETKARPEQLDAELLRPHGFRAYWHSAERRGYSGVVTYSRRRSLEVREGLGIPEFDREGRVLCCEYPGFVLVNAYFPNSQREHGRLDYKLRFCRAILRFLNRLRRRGKNIVLCGDYNIAHREIDLRNPRENRDNPGFLPQERAWMDRFIRQRYVDCFRHFCAEPDHYTWWSYRPGVRERNIGWRIDYFFVTRELVPRLRRATHQTDVMGSDHCPIALELR